MSAAAGPETPDHENSVIQRPKSSRPVHLDLTTFKFPITSQVSILHRISGLFLFLVIPLALWALEYSLASQESFEHLKSIMGSTVAKAVFWVISSALAYHLVAGIKHLLMDWGVGETLEGGQLGARVTLVVSSVLIIFLAFWIW